MAKIERTSLLSLEAYARQREEFRARVMEHKKNRTVHLGENLILLFEDELTMRYQVQEMLRAERIFEEEGIADELKVYNPLIPDGRNLKATMMLAYPDVAERKEKLARLKGIDGRVWLQVAGFEKVFAIADEDIERETEEKTSSVHFVRFDLTDEMAQALKQGANLSAGVDHPEYRAEVAAIPQNVRNSLVSDLA
jgi:hypothetical protein